MWNSSENETKKIWSHYMDHIFTLIYCLSYTCYFVVISLDFKCFCQFFFMDTQDFMITIRASDIKTRKGDGLEDL